MTQMTRRALCAVMVFAVVPHEGTIVMKDGGEKYAGGGVAWNVWTEPNAEGKRTKISYSYDKVPTFILPAGPCQIAFRSGDLKATADANVTAGQLTELKLTIKK